MPETRQQRVLRLTSGALWLAPLAGLTDIVFREICKQQGAEVMITEMVSGDGLVYSRERSIPYAMFSEEQRPVGVQLFGSDPDIMARAVEIILPLEPDFIDVNMGCPVRKVVNRGAGSALMRDASRAQAIVRSMKNVLSGTEMPLSVKFRAGWDKQSVNAVEFGQRMEEAGADILILHPRTRTQMYGGHSDWSLIGMLKKRVEAPLIGNGDIRTPEEALLMFRQTTCDGVMIGRGAVGSPWLFRQIREYLLTGAAPEISYKDRFEIVRNHLMKAIEREGREYGVRNARTHVAAYTRGCAGGARVRDTINHTLDPDVILEAIGGLYNG